MEEFITEAGIREANRRFDTQHPTYRNDRTRISAGWQGHRALLGKPLTDRRIEEYERQGFYSESIREAQRAYRARRRWFRRL